jgi:hypothetical protein
VFDAGLQSDCRGDLAIQPAQTQPSPWVDGCVFSSRVLAGHLSFVLINAKDFTLALTFGKEISNETQQKKFKNSRFGKYRRTIDQKWHSVTPEAQHQADPAFLMRQTLCQV